jgi:hypothetical protein
VRNQIFSVDNVQDGLGHVAMWETRCALPLAVSATVELLSAHDRLALSCAITRLVNGLTDPLQGQRARNLRFIAQELQLPMVLVDVRHEATHGVLPSLALLERCRKEALTWLSEYYWHGKQRERLVSPSVTLLREGALAPWNELGGKVRVEKQAVEELVTLRIQRFSAVEVQHEIGAPMLWPAVPRWTQQDEEEQIASVKQAVSKSVTRAEKRKKARVDVIAASVDF